MTLEELEANLEGLQQQALRVDGAIQFLLQAIAQMKLRVVEAAKE